MMDGIKKVPRNKQSGPLFMISLAVFMALLLLGVKVEATETDNGIIRCLTPLLMNDAAGDHTHPVLQHHSLDLHTLAARLSEHPDTLDMQVYESESGRFRLFYTTEGPDSVWTEETGIGEPGVPDYIILAAQYADSSYRHQVERLGYTDPLNSTRCEPAIGEQIEILFYDIPEISGKKVYGYFNPNTPSRFSVNSTFSDSLFHRNDDYEIIAGIPGILGALKVTIAHELKHVIQYATNCFDGNEINVHWKEMDATMMENVVFPNVNDYYNYIGGTAGIFGNPETRFPRSYSHVTFMLYYHEDFGDHFWVDVWDEIGEEHLAGRNISMLEAMDRVITERRRPGDANDNGPLQIAGNGFSNIDIPDLEQSLLRNYLWHLASGDRSLFSYGFSERWNYPEAKFQSSYEAIPYWPDPPVGVSFHSARFFEFRADQMDGVSGEVALALFNSDLPLGIGLLGKSHNGYVLEYFVKAEGKKRQKIILPVNWEDLDWLGLVTMNTTGGSPTNNLQLMAGEGPAIERLVYGDITKTEELTDDDARWMLAHTLNPTTLSPFDRFLGDVSGNGSLTPYDAARVLMNLDNGTPFPVDDNLDSRGPEWSRFYTIGSGDTSWTSISKTGEMPADTIEATLQVLNGQVLAEQPMDILLSVTGPSGDTATTGDEEPFGGSSLSSNQSHSSQPEWSAVYLDLEIDYPPEGGGTQPGEPITLEVVELSAGNTYFYLQEWDYDLTEKRLQLVFASSGQLASSTDPSRILTLRLIPQNEGLIHFRIADLQLDEIHFEVDHPEMDTLRVMGPVQAGEPGNADGHVEEKPLVFGLEQNYPNPFNPETVIRFSLPESDQTSLVVYDIAGRRVATLIDGHMERGIHQVRMDAEGVSGISSGIYVYRLQSGGQVQTRKMTVIK